MVEMRKDIHGYEGVYQVSDLGNIKSLARVVKRNKMGPLSIEERILKPVLHNDGYLGVSLCKNRSYKSCRISRLVAAAFISNDEKHPIVMHIDNNKLNNRCENLRRGTASQNIQQAYDDGLLIGPKPWLGKFGSEHCRSKSYNGILAPLQ